MAHRAARHLHSHGKHTGYAPAIWVMLTVVALYISALFAILWLLHGLVAALLDIAASLTMLA